MAEIVVDVVGESDIGLVRERNEDTLLVADLTDHTQHEVNGTRTFDVREGGLLFSVFDGMGGAAAGDRASRLAAEVFFERVSGAGARSREDLARTMGAGIVEANRRLRRAGQEDPSLRGMGTTLTAAAVLDANLVVTHVGDSRAYLVRGGSMVQITEDQSLVQELVTQGHIRREEAATYEHSNVILQALGVNEDLVPFAAEVPLQRGDTLMLCTDGLTTMVPHEEMQEVLTSKGEDIAAAATALTGLARVNGGHDNITLVLVRFRGDGLTEVHVEESPEGAEARRPAIEVRPIALGLQQPRRSIVGLSPLALAVLAVLLMLVVAGVIILLGMD
jgi:PPM family protein phosphatase